METIFSIHYPRFRGRVLIILLALLTFNNSGISQISTNEDIASLIKKLKEDDRGPFKDIKWHCADGTLNDAKVPCDQEGSVQHARLKDNVLKLQSSHNIYLGQILSAGEGTEFWDKDHFYDRFKQYQLEQFLKNANEGWIWRKAQFYRGAVQAEDEMDWGKKFLMDLCSDDQLVQDQYFLIRQAINTLPHADDDQSKQKIRAISKNISDAEPSFMKMRIKIHGAPDKSDITTTKKYVSEHPKIKQEVQKELSQLIRLLEIEYQPIDYESKIKSIERLSSSITAKSLIIEAFTRLKSPKITYPSLVVISDALNSIRSSVITKMTAASRIRLLEISLDLESILLNRLSELKLESLGDINGSICYLSQIVHATGYIESWEWNHLESSLSSAQFDKIALYDQMEFQTSAKNAIEWGANMVRAHYNPTVNKIGPFEPLAYGLIDDIVRSSALLPLGTYVSRLGEWLNGQLKYANDVVGIPKSTQIRGLNAGFAKGKLSVLSGDIENIAIDKSRIYIFDQPPSDLKPIAGIATVSEGNPVSHIQLLARNLGIPNAVITIDDFRKLREFDGEEIFYAVSSKGTVIVKLAKDMSTTERELFESKERPEDKITVPTDKLILDQPNILNLRDLSKDDSGVSCGPKAANLGELKQLFEDKVVEGIVIPFSIFKSHMDQKIPNRTESYWEYLNESFLSARTMASNGNSEEEIEVFVLEKLTTLRTLIKEMAFIPSFDSQLETKFKSVLGKPIGSIPVFLRSDTNMEDLKDFTGAGLNLTVFNVLDKAAIVKGIKDVWASPYNERSYKWRQKFLLNPENVYPSILIIPSVNVNSSGVLITKGLSSNKFYDNTLAFSRGVGGAVDGQAAEGYTLSGDGFNNLNAPSREIKFRSLPKSGGSVEIFTSFAQPILNADNLKDVRLLSNDVRKLINFSTEANQIIAHDIEFGFLDDKIWLFQIRPFVENKNANNSTYLNSISPPTPSNQMYKYTTPINL